jgi:fructose-1,6-bisphosphatase/inositol monophosphatase family enzyme
MTDDDLLGLLARCATAVEVALRGVSDWGPSGLRDGQYAADLVADAAALDVLRAAGVGVLSEESGLEGGSRDVVVIVDPLDGSTNASRRVPWYATALCAVRSGVPVAALVVNQANGARYSAVRGGGAWCDRRRLVPSSCDALGSAILALNGMPGRPFGWKQFRVFGAAALDLCLVADGVVDGYVDCAEHSHGVWDYAASVLICEEAGAPVVDAFGRDLIVLDPSERRTPVAAGTPALLESLIAARSSNV